MKKVAVFGLSANPPTGLHGHQGIVRRLCISHQFDEVWILPVFTHMYASKRDLLIPFEYRVQMCHLCFDGETTEGTTVRVTELEKSAFEAQNCSSSTSEKQYLGTVDIVDIIKRDEPACSITLVLGGDAFRDLLMGKWKQSQRLLEENSFYVFSRKGAVDAFNLRDLLSTSSFSDSIDQGRIQIDDEAELDDISSSQFRALLGPHARGNSSAPDTIIHPEVMKYIQNNELYGVGLLEDV